MYENIIAKILFIIGIAQITVGILGGILCAIQVSDYVDTFSWGIFFAWSIGGITIGMLFIGFAENIQLLQRINSKMNVEELDQEEELVEAIPTDPNDWFLPGEDREKIEQYYQNETIIDITPSNEEGYCVVKLEYGSNEFVRVIDIHGFGVREVQDEEIRSSIITWYNNQP
ncbi:hypothetical protein LG329_14285 [Virgibacillus necropolis]|uniref:hypothetical protein n=1 Tax=Virgibacillus necropolis TaxID=163877 RepID=UPI00384F5BC5